MRLIFNFFILITGVSGLIYQVSWQKYLARLLGADSIATAIILGTFLGGLSLGYYLCGRLTLAVKNQFRTYAILEGVIGLWGLGFPLIFRIIESATYSWSFSYPVAIIVQGVICSVILMAIPTICMGGTIPILTKGLSKNIKESTNTHAGIYAVNTAGAFIGTLLAGFFLIPIIGLPGSVLTAAILNLAASAFFYSLAPYAAAGDVSPIENQLEIHEPMDTKAAAGYHEISPRILYAISFLSGCYVMALENALIRLTNLSFGSSSYSFAIIVSVFILLIAVGSFIVSRLPELSKNLLCVTQAVIAASLLAVYVSMDTWPYLAHLIRISCQSNIAGMALYYIAAFVFICLVLAVPVSCMGATLPIIFHEIKKDMEHIGRHSGNIFSFNTLGSLAGSLVGGIVLYHFLDIREIFLVSVCLASVSAWLASKALPRRFYYLTSALMPVVAVITLTTPWYTKTHFKLGTFRKRAPLAYSFQGPRNFFEHFTGTKEMKLYDDDTVGTVSVLEFDIPPQGRRGTSSREMSVVVNGKSDSATYESTVRMLAHIPALLATKKDNALVIGMGTGITAGELTLYPEVRSIDVAEISPSVIKAFPLFENYNHQVHRDPRLNILQGDAFNILKGTDKTYDIIISEPSNPWVTGVDSLFSKEFYSLVNRHLNEAGVFVQWLHFYEASDKMVGIAVKTLSESFKYCRGFVVGDEADVIFICSNTDLAANSIVSAEKTMKKNVNVSRSLQKTGIRVIEQLLVREVWSPAYISANFSDYPSQTLDKPILHYVAGRDFFMGKLAPIEFIFDQKTANFSEDFLLAKKYPNWKNFELYGNVTSFLIHGLGQFEYLKPVNRHLNLRAYFNNPESSKLPAKLANDPVLKIIPLITGESQDRGVWMQVGLHFAPHRVKAQKLFEIISRTRNWIVPYPLNGMKNFLNEGIRSTKDVYEKNWLVLQFCQLLLAEQAEMKQVRAVFDLAVKGNNGQVMIRPEDVALLKKIRSKIKKGHVN
jgi:spermidine synthase